MRRGESPSNYLSYTIDQGDLTNVGRFRLPMGDDNRAYVWVVNASRTKQPKDDAGLRLLFWTRSPSLNQNSNPTTFPIFAKYLGGSEAKNLSTVFYPRTTRKRRVEG